MRLLPRKLLLASAVVASSVFASFAGASPFQSARVASGAMYVLHVDTEALTRGKLFELLRSRLDANQQSRLEVGLELAQSFAGVDLLADLHDVTLYGTGFDEDSAVLLLHGRWDPARLGGLLGKARDYEVTPHGARSVIRWRESRGDKPRFGSFVGNDLIVLGGTEAAVKSALDVVDDGSKAMTAEAGPAIPRDAGGVIAFISADAVNQLRAQGIARSPIIARIQSGWVSVAEADDRLVVRGDVQATTPAAAKQLQTTLNGMKALAALLLNDDSKPAANSAIELLQAATTTVEADHLKLEWALPFSTLTTIVDEVKVERGQPTTQPR